MTVKITDNQYMLDDKMVVAFSVSFPKKAIDDMTVKQYRNAQDAVKAMVAELLAHSERDWNVAIQKALDEIISGGTFRGNIILSSLKDYR
jgi:hypothetical protein